VRRFTNIASLSSIPATFLEFEFDFWTAYLMAFVSLIVCLAALVALKPRLGELKDTPSLRQVHSLMQFTVLVKVVPHEGILVKAVRALNTAARNGFKLDHAKGSYQMEKHGRTVPWEDDFIEELKRGLVACRVM